jgi:hypothetical protein
MSDTLDRHAWADRLSEYLDDELPPPERAALDEHLRECAGCRAVLEDLRRVSVRAKALRDRDPDQNLWPEIARRIGRPEAAWAVAGGGDEGDELAARRRRKVWAPWLGAGAAAAAVLVLGIGIGRFTAPGDPELPTARVEAPAPGTPLTSDPYRLAAVQHLSRTEALLTTFRAEAGRGTTDPAVAGWADDLLTQTRLLLDSPAADDPRLRALLEDLELVLAQIARLPRQNPDTEVDLAERAIERSRVLPRMRTLVPAGPAALQGES